MSKFELVEDPAMFPYLIFKAKDHAGIETPTNCEGSIVAAAKPKKKSLLWFLRAIFRGYINVVVYLLTILSVVSLLAPCLGIGLLLIFMLNQPNSPAQANITHESEQTNCRDLVNWALDDNTVAITKAVLENMEGPLIGGKFLEVGQFEDGKSVTVALEIGLLWQGVLMGPNPWAMDDLKGPERTALRIHGCISTGKAQDLMPLTFDADRQIVHNRAVTNGGQLMRVFVPCFPLMEVLRRAEGYQKLDLLYLGTGSSAEPLDKIVESLKFDVISIQVIGIVEPNTVANKRAKNATERAYNILKTHGYDMAKKIGDTTIFAKKLPSHLL